MSNDVNTIPELVALKDRFMKSTGLDSAQADQVIQKFTSYFVPRWGATTDRQTINLMKRVAEYEGFLS